MTVVARRVRSTPLRTGSETWRLVIDLIAAKSSDARRKLMPVEGVAACLIADEAAGEAPIVVAGTGPRLRVYCLYGEDAVSGESASEEALSWDPTAGDWRVWLPAPEEDLAWVTRSLKKIGSRVLAYNADEADGGQQSGSRHRAELQVDVEGFKRP